MTRADSVKSESLALVHDPMKTVSRGMSVILVPGARPMYFSARSTLSASSFVGASLGEGILSVTPTVIAGFVPQPPYDIENDIFGRNPLTKPPPQGDCHLPWLLDPDGLSSEDVLTLARAYPKSERAQRAVGGGVAVAARQCNPWDGQP